MKKKSIEATAYHEAGHAIMYINCFKRFRHVTIIPKNNTLGFVHGFKPHQGTIKKLMAGDVTFDTAIREIMCSWAGVLAEERFMGKKVRAGFWSDTENIADYAIRLIAEEEQEPFFNWIQIRTTRIIGERWNEIEAVAKALLDKRKLAYKEVIDIVVNALD